MRTFPRHAARRDLPRRGAAPDRLRRALRGALGRERERVQPARPAPHLSVPRLRRARSRAQARAGTRPGDRAVRLGARGPGGAPAARSATSPRWRSWARSGPTASASRSTIPAPRPGQPFALVRDLDGAPRRHEPRGAHQRAHRPALAAALPRRPDWCARRSCCCTSGCRGRLELQEPQTPARGRSAPRSRAGSAGGARGGHPATPRRRTSRCWATGPTP